MSTEDLSALTRKLWLLGSYYSSELAAPLVLAADVVNGVAENNYSALRVPGAVAGYQVTAGKTLYLTKAILSSSVINTPWLALSGTADAGDSQVAAPAGAAALDSRADGVPNPLTTQAVEIPTIEDILLIVAAALYPCVRNMLASSTLHVLMFGHEE